MSKVWILKSEYNAYDQYGEYFEKVWFHKPSEDELSEFLQCTKQFAQEFLNGKQGRQGTEEVWYNLTEYEE